MPNGRRNVEIPAQYRAVPEATPMLAVLEMFAAADTLRLRRFPPSFEFLRVVRLGESAADLLGSLKNARRLPYQLVATTKPEITIPIGDTTATIAIEPITLMMSVQTSTLAGSVLEMHTRDLYDHKGGATSLYRIGTVEYGWKWSKTEASDVILSLKREVDLYSPFKHGWAPELVTWAWLLIAFDNEIKNFKAKHPDLLQPKTLTWLELTKLALQRSKVARRKNPALN